MRTSFFLMLFFIQMVVCKANHVAENALQFKNTEHINIKSNNNVSDTTITVIKHPKLTAAVLSLTLGMLGAHRLFLGSKPWVPLFYVLTVGGVFFILPIIDFVVIVTSNDVEKYYNNNQILMWLNK